MILLRCIGSNVHDSISACAVQFRQADRPVGEEEVSDGGRHNDTELHLTTMVTSGEAELDAEVAEIRATMMNEGEEKSLFIVAEKGALEIVDQMLKDSNWESVSRKNRLRLCCSPWGTEELIVQ
ncbi:hypothetical protein BHM03_00056339, partial [Ensete ventricosum]